MTYKVNWIKTSSGNGINSGDTLQVNIDGVDYISGAVYKDKFPVLVFFEMGAKVSLRLVKGRTWFGKAKPLPKGTYVLKCRTASNGWDDEFEIV